MSEGVPKSNKAEKGGGANAIREKVESELKEADFEKSLRVIAQLEQEVENMVMPERFSNTEIETFTSSGEISNSKGLTIAESKRKQLLEDLGRLKKKIEGAKQDFIDTTTDIAATKLPGGWLD